MQNKQPPKTSYTQIDVIKKNEDTILAAEKIASRLNIDSNFVSWAGLKDNRAITVQRMTIKGDYRHKIANLEFDNFFIKATGSGYAKRTKKAQGVGARTGPYRPLA